jgi:hypothetical protein
MDGITVERQKLIECIYTKKKGQMVSLYEAEYDTWLEEQIQALQQGKPENLDVPHLIEELEALVRGEKSAVENFAYQIILHLLLIDYWSEESLWNRRHWCSEVDNFQFQLKNRLTKNLKMHLVSRLDYIYGKARKAAIDKTGIRDRFPEQNIYDLSQILDEDDLLQM